MSFHEYGIGATAVGLRGQDFVVLAAEKRISYGGFVVSHAGKKVYKISDYLGVALAGLFADMQAIAKIISAEMEYYMLTLGRPMKVEAAARLLAAILYSNKYYPFFSEVLVGGIDLNGGSRLFVMDPLGSLIEDEYAAIGSGAPIAIGVIEREYRKDLSVSEARDLAVNAIKAAIERDAVSGGGIDILVIQREGNVVRSTEELVRL
ncbi:MAG: archaeal proteasome endopeptidase complex subunit beta [Thermoproteota archaeon]